mgnify:CR=1 FL=1
MRRVSADEEFYGPEPVSEIKSGVKLKSRLR